MVRIQLSNRQLNVIKSVFKSYSNCFSVENEYIICVDNKTDLEFLIDNLLNEFIETGLKENDEPNEYGLELEELNQKFITELQKINDGIL